MGTQQQKLKSIVIFLIVVMVLHEKERGKISKLTADINQI